MRQQRELELKVELSESDVVRLSGKLPLSDFAIAPPSRRRVRSIYFDTPEHSLHAAGISLRLRRHDKGWLQTVKTEQRIDGGLSNPVELEASVQAEKPDLRKIADKNLRRRVEKAIKGNSLRPVFETVVQRTTRRVQVEDSEIELAVDKGKIVTNAATRQLREAELELKSGSTAGLLLAAETLFAGHELKLSSRSKAERGYRLALGKSGRSAEPRSARAPRVKPKHTCAEAFSAILASATEQILANRQAVLETNDPEGAHQLRVGLRRLRSALRALRPLAASASLRQFESLARDIARCVGTLRDADVLISAIHAPAEALSSDKRGFVELHEALVRHREIKRDEVKAALCGAAWSRLQIYLTLWPRTLEEADALHQPIRKYARKTVNKRWRKTATYGRELDELSPERRHEMRKSLKELRYLAEFFAALFRKRSTRRFIAQLKRLQDVFGYLNDVRIAPQLRSISEKQDAGLQAATAASYIVGRHDAEALHVWRGAAKAWGRLKASPRFWK
jgi:triphosphatase